MRISVAIATYNRARMVREAVLAAAAQTLRPDEIVVADDASTDATLGLLSRANGPVRIVLQESNTGGVPNWNTAVDSTRGDFVAWCSDDDRWLPDHLEASIGFLEANPEVGFVHSHFIDSIEGVAHPVLSGRPLRSSSPLRVDRSSLLAYLVRYYNWPFHPSTIVMQREVWERTGPFNPRYAFADTDWFIRAIERFPSALLPRYGVVNRRHRGNWSNRLGSVRLQREILEIVEGAISRCSGHGLPSALGRLSWKAAWRFETGLHHLLYRLARARMSEAEIAASVVPV